MINFLLLIIAVFLFVTIGGAGFLYAIVKSAITGIFSFLNEYFWLAALSIDQAGNVVCMQLFNDLLIKKDNIHPFGHENETVSHVLGKNKAAENLTFLGKFLSYVLHLIDRYHVEKAAETPQ